ncbi:hypothetical protein J2R96_003993 [Bradyrhizobium elkanii]|nr:hypothetical protein [Bradyrhizobium elkanii]
MIDTVRSMASALCSESTTRLNEFGIADIRVADSTDATLKPESIDFVLTSPPYCTRIDYTAATRVELAVLAPLISTPVGDLKRRMTGSVRVPQHEIQVSSTWGPSCIRFLKAMRKHKSKASAGYYYKTHLDYFDKISRSIAKIGLSLKGDGRAVFVVQDSHYKELHNDLPTVLSEMAEISGLRIKRRVEFESSLSMARINSRARQYRGSAKKVEAVLCFEKN